MAKQSINIGSAANDRTGDTLRAAGDKVNDNFDELYTALGDGTTLSSIATETYVDTAISNVINAAPEALDTLNELAAALGDDASFSTTVSTALGNRLRVDVDNQGLNSTQQGNALTNLGITSTTAELNILDGVTADATEINVLDGITASTTELNYVDGVTSAIQTQLDAKAASASLATVATSGDYTDLSNTPTIPTASSLSVDDLITLSGVAEGAVSLGSFTGTTITDDSTVKTALQELETAVETKQASITTLLTLTASTSEPTVSAGTFAVADGTSWDPASKSGAVPYPVFYDGVAWTALY